MPALYENLESPFLNGEVEHFERETSAAASYFVVVDEGGAPLGEGDYTLVQGKVSQSGPLGADGRVPFGKVDPARPFLFELRDRVCMIENGAFFDPDDEALQYGGTWFDWRLVRDDKNPAKAFWPYYKAALKDVVLPFGVDRLLQHEHITRRPIQVEKACLKALDKVRIRAVPLEVRTGPFVRYTDHERAVIWLETLTPAMVRVRFKKAGGKEESRFASTVRVGGRYFGVVELDGLQVGTLYDYTLELAPLPLDKIPIQQADFAGAFPKLKPRVQRALAQQLAGASLNDREWLSFRTLLPLYGAFKFATGSCRWFPADKRGKDYGPDMLDGLGAWLRTNPREKWPAFGFYSGDQIYSDECGDDHAEKLIQGRFASRIPGPFDSKAALSERLVDGAWAGRFAHRFKPYKDPDVKFVERLRKAWDKLTQIFEKYPQIYEVRRDFPDSDPEEKLKWRHQLFKNQRGSAKTETPYERQLREAVSLLPQVKALEISSEPFKPLAQHWKWGFNISLRKNPMRSRFLNYNFLLWQFPNFEKWLPSVTHKDGPVVLRAPDQRAHPAAVEGVHTSDFAEYACIYERAWTSSRNVRVLMAHLPSFMIFDDHEVTDDWNFDFAWVRMLHNARDDYRMWPKTLTDSLAAYWVYQGYCNKPPSQWKADDPRVKALTDAQSTGTDALPALRKCIYDACWHPRHTHKDRHQAGLSLDWHYKLPFEPLFLVPDCRSRKLLVPGDDSIRIIDHDDPKGRPESRTLDTAQLAWIQSELELPRRQSKVAFLATSTPFLMQKRVMDIMRKPETAAAAAITGSTPASVVAAVGNSTALGMASDALLRLFRRERDLEHMVRDGTWRDLWSIVEGLNQAKSPLQTLVFVSGDVHHSYCMTGNLPGNRSRPELLQVTCSGFQTTIRSDLISALGEDFGSSPFEVGKYRLVPGFMDKNGDLQPDLVLFQNSAALVQVQVGADVNVRVEYLSGTNHHVYRYTSGAAYMTGPHPTFSPYTKGKPRVVRAS
ncbi:MAG: hypothetical protein QM756_34975 [Polyangiaceae bacterium]